MTAECDPPQDIWLQLSSAASRLEAALGQCFGQQIELRPLEPRPWSELTPADLQTAGLVVQGARGGAAYDLLLPATLRWLAGSATPDAAAQAPWTTLAAQWASLTDDESRPASDASCLAVPNLYAHVAGRNPGPETAVLEWTVIEEGAPVGLVFVVGPLHSAQPADSSPPVSSADPSPPPPRPSPRPAPPTGAQSLARLRSIPVTVSVTLAEKRIPVAQLLCVTPGALITFNKSCEDLLDLYVNNVMYCRGEAVKIGENFGLKINQIGPPPPRPSKLIPG
jgi:flagellar motor switch protein FliN/FliY